MSAPNDNAPIPAEAESPWNGFLYWDKNDSRFLVPKRNPWLGWTINLGHPWAGVAVLSLILLPVGVAVAPKFMQQLKR